MCQINFHPRNQDVDIDTLEIIFSLQFTNYDEASGRLSDLVYPSTCLFKEVGGYLTRCTHDAASIALNS